MRGEAGCAVGVPLRLQKGRVVRLVPDREERDGRAERAARAVVARHGAHEFLEVFWIGFGDVRRFLVRRRPARHRRGEGQQDFPVQPLRFCDQRVVFAPCVVAGVGHVERGLARARWAGGDVEPVELDAQCLDAERLHLHERMGARTRAQQVTGTLEVGGSGCARRAPERHRGHRPRARRRTQRGEACGFGAWWLETLRGGARLRSRPTIDV